MKNFMLMHKEYLVNTYPNRRLILVEGEGVYLKDISGEKYLDLMTNYGVNIFGYKHPFLTASLIHQIQRLTSLHGSFVNDKRTEAAQALVSRCGRGLSQVFFSNSGAEAIETALKFAVLATGKKRFVVCCGGFHGKTLGALSATGGDKYRQPFEPLLWDFKHIEYNDLPALESCLDHQTAGFIVEPIQGEGGIEIPDIGYLSHAKKICESKNILFILDEIQTGAGRTAHFLASEREGISGDILCLGKGLAGGIPCGATLVTQQIAGMIPRSAHSSTFGGNPLAGAGILATLSLLDDERLEHIRRIGDYFLEALRGIRSDWIIKVKGQGLMLGVEVRERRDDILKELQKQRVLAIPAAERVVRFLPPYILEKEHVDFAVDKLKNIFNSLDKN